MEKTETFRLQGTEREHMFDWQILTQIQWTTLLLGGVLIFLVIGAWVLLDYRVDPLRGTMDEPDATAFVRGRCGDAMKISLRFSDERVTEAKYWTDGCRMSSACGAAAAELALNKSPEELADIDHKAIEERVGTLPEEDFHCATLASGAIQEALRIYLTQTNTKSSSGAEMQARDLPLQKKTS
jgi:nitrogen fixation NifU-like protein